MKSVQSIQQKKHLTSEGRYLWRKEGIRRQEQMDFKSKQKTLHFNNTITARNSKQLSEISQNQHFKLMPTYRVNNDFSTVKIHECFLINQCLTAP